MQENAEKQAVAILVGYLGGSFCGFARQEGLTTVQGELEQALRTLFSREVQTVCAGRTDSGVHARGQVVSFDLLPHELEGRTLRSVKRSLNALTHDDIVVKAIALAPEGFSARFDADCREYRYRLAVGGDAPLFTRGFTWYVPSVASVDLDSMQQAASHLVGEHDFKSFCVAASAVGKNTNRFVRSIDIYEEDVFGEPGIVIRVVGNAFLHSMIRTIVGTLMEVGCGRRDPEWVKDVLEARERKAAGPKAPPEGLVFWKVTYGNLPEMDQDAKR